MQSEFNTPILFLVFNRLDTASKVFGMIKKIKPRKLFVASDGPRNDAEAENVHKVRRMVEVGIDWECELEVLYREKNLGCKQAVSEAMDWFFDRVEEGIILEDDCLPDQSFFSFCQNLLEEYRNDNRVMHIGGTNFQHGKTRGKDSYYFSKFSHIWGWATWRRAWKLYDVNMKSYPEFVKSNTISQIWNERYLQCFWIKALNSVYDGKLDTWDHQWTYAVWINGGLSIVPNENLVTNIGFGVNATHTKGKNIIANLPAVQLCGISHPRFFVIDHRADAYYGRNFSLIKKLINKVLVYLKQ
jgi:hypothetical protein